MGQDQTKKKTIWARAKRKPKRGRRRKKNKMKKNDMKKDGNIFMTT